MDEKGRTTIPSKFLSFLKSSGAGLQLIITKEIDDFSLRVYTAIGWNELQESLDATNPGEEIVDSFRDLVGSGAELIEVHPKTGRISIPALLREYAGLEKNSKILFIGNGNKKSFKIWNEQRWEIHENQLLQKLRENKADLARNRIKF